RPGKGGRRSCSSARSSVISSPRRSARVARIWPSLMKLGPSSAKAAASRSPGRAVAAPRRRRERVALSNGALGTRLPRAVIGNSASCRTRVRPIRRRRARLRTLRMNPNTARLRSEPPGRMNGGDAAGQVSVARPVEPRRFDPFRERALRWEAADALDEIVVSRAIAGDDLTEHGQHLKAVKIVERLQWRGDGRGEFEAEKPPARLEDAPGLGQRLIDPGHIAQAKRDRAEIEGAVGKRQRLGIAAEPLDPPENAVVERSGAADLQHLW